MASLGQDLKRERELRGISLREIADSTRISLKFLQAIEDDRLGIIPGGFFIRAILRSYAKSIGIDEHQVINRYQEMQLFDEQLNVRIKNEKLPPAKDRRRRTVSRPLFWIAGAGALAASALLYFIVFSSRQPPPALKTAIEPSSPVVAESPLPPPSQSPTPLILQEEQGVLLEMKFGEKTWLRILADGNLAWDGIKNAGETLEIRAERELLIHCGNAGGATLSLNGKSARPLGPSGAVRKDIRITVENWREFLLASKEN